MWPNENEARYKKLGGWLMFIAVMSILVMVSNAISLPGQLSRALAAGYANVVPGWYNTAGLLLSILLLASNALVVVFLFKRNRRPFGISFYVSRALAAVNAATTALLYSGNKDTIESYAWEVVNTIPGYMDMVRQSGMDLASLMRMITNVLVVFYWGIALGYLAVLAAWVFYFRRSRRVAVYFDPYYVALPEHPQAPYGAPYGYPPAGQPGQQYPQQPPYGQYPQQPQYPQQQYGQYGQYQQQPQYPAGQYGQQYPQQTQYQPPQPGQYGQPPAGGAAQPGVPVYGYPGQPPAYAPPPQPQPYGQAPTSPQNTPPPEPPAPPPAPEKPAPPEPPAPPPDAPRPPDEKGD